MKDSKITAIEEKYWRGETTLQEDNILQSYYESHPEDANALSALLKYYQQERQITYNKPIVSPAPSGAIISMRLLMSMAASMILLGAAYFAFGIAESKKNEIVIDDPQVALQITMDAFGIINQKIEKSTNTFKNGMNHLDKTLIFKTNL